MGAQVVIIADFMENKMRTRTCTKCGLEKDIEEFPLRNQLLKDGNHIAKSAINNGLTGTKTTKTIRKQMPGNIPSNTAKLSGNTCIIIYCLIRA